MLLLLLLLGGLRYAHAQNTPGGPYYFSWQKYQVPNVVSPNYDWYIFDILSDAQSFTGGTHLQNTLDHVKGIALDEGTATIEIYFDKTIFSPGRDYFLVFSEYSEANGTCTARRMFPISITDNTFYFSAGNNIADCHPLGGEVLNWTNYNGIPAEISLDFGITLHKAGDFNIKQYTFNGTIDFDEDNYTLVSVSVAGAIATTLDVATGVFSITLNDAPYEAGNTGQITHSFTLVVNISGLIYDSETVTVSLTGGRAESGTNYNIVTDEENPPPIGTKREQERIIWPLPATTNISVSD